MANVTDYSAVKKAIIEAWRVFLPAFLTVIIIQFKVGIDLTDWNNWLPALIGSALLSGIKAVVKWYREKYAKGEYEKLVYKLPL